MENSNLKMGDKFAWLGRTGLAGSGSKSADVAGRGVKVREHMRGAPKGSTGAQAPDGQPNPAMVGAAAHRANPSEQGPGAATLAARKPGGATPASAKIESGERSGYEKAEKKTLASLKGGGTEKELREGHNTGKSMRPGGGGRFAAMEKKLSGKVDNPAAVAASIGRKKYGAKQMAKWSAAGRKRGMK